MNDLLSHSPGKFLKLNFQGFRYLNIIYTWGLEDVYVCIIYMWAYDYIYHWKISLLPLSNIHIHKNKDHCWCLLLFLEVCIYISDKELCPNPPYYIWSNIFSFSSALFFHLILDSILIYTFFIHLYRHIIFTLWWSLIYLNSSFLIDNSILNITYCLKIVNGNLKHVICEQSK